jgi:4-hydroxy-tetrahydrodipicolinate reductase
LYFRIIEQAAKLINQADEYDVWGHEIHHKNKIDSPSGTAKTLEEILIKNIVHKTSIVEEKLDRKIKDNEIHFSSTRGGLSNFAHTIGFDSEADCIEIKHFARNRNGYALGAIKCAEWLEKQPVGFYTMDDYLKELFN